MSRTDDVFKPALQDKKIPILTLDNTWHRLFTQTEPTPRIKELEAELNDLLKKQGKLNTETKEIRNLKKRLMDEIVELMDELGKQENKKTQKKLEENKRLIEECNEKLQNYGDDLYDIPKRINEVNYELMLETMEICYEQIQDNNEEIEEISKWVDEMRVELKKKVVIKQQKLQRNQNFYTYMHSIFGADVIDIFDMKYQVNPLTDHGVIHKEPKEEPTTDDKKN